MEPALIGPQLATTPDGRRLHLNHGPIDLIIEAWGRPRAVLDAYRRAWVRFETVLDELVAELSLLRRPAGSGVPEGAVARRMAEAVTPFAGSFITPMAAVAGAVADEVAEVMRSGADLERAHVNNGGDIAILLADGERFDVGVVTGPHLPLGRMSISAADPVRGIATSGQRGRSHSLGIADAVTVLAASAAAADAAATLLANSVDLPGHPAVGRVPACDVDPDTDLGSRFVTEHVGALNAAEIDAALERGRVRAEEMIDAGQIVAAVLCLERSVVDAGSLTRGTRSGAIGVAASGR